MTSQSKYSIGENDLTHANSLDPNEMPSVSESHFEPSGLTLCQYSLLNVEGVCVVSNERRSNIARVQNMPSCKRVMWCAKGQ